MEESSENEEIANEEEVSMPPVEIVVVAHNPDDWFGEVLTSLAVQNYLNLKVTILSTGPIEPIQQIADEYLPASEVLEVNPNHGFGRNLNAVLARSEHPAFYLFCHHDVSLAPDAVRLMVEESLRSNAAIIGPKIVNWDRPNELLDVGYNMDKLGYPIGRVEMGELDQEQYDSVSEVFVVSTTATLVRADLFLALGGFDEAMGMVGEDVDLCWRAHLAGARVMVVPLAIARHREEIGDYQIGASKTLNRERHRLRAVLSNYGPFHSFRVIPQAFMWSLIQALSGIVSGNLSRFRTFLGSWAWNLTRPRSLLQRRREIRLLRQVSDSQIRSIQIRGLVPIKRLFTSTETNFFRTGTTRSRFGLFLDEIRNGPSRVSLTFLAAFTTIFLFGSRHLVTRTIPVVGDLVPFDLGVKEFFVVWYSGFWQSGIGYEGTSPTALGIVGTLGVLFWGCLGFLRLVMTLGMIPIGVLGVWFFLKPFSSSLIRTMGAAIYFAAPVSYHSLSNGSWDGLILFGCLPWALLFLGRASKSSPFGPVGGLVGASTYETDIFRETLTLGFLLGVVLSFSPVSIVTILATLVLLCVGSVVAGWPIGFSRMTLIFAMSCMLAAALNLPWILDNFVTEPSWTSIFGTRSNAGESINIFDALRLSADSAGNSIFGWGFPVLGVAPLLLARGERWAWAVRGWALYLGGVAAVWLGGMGYLPMVLPKAETLLVPSALGIAITAAMGVGALQRDLQTYRFGWRQLVPITTVVAFLLAVLPTLGSSFSGDWGMPDDQLNTVLTIQEENLGDGRVLWIGDDDVLAQSGQQFAGDFTVAVSSNLRSTFVDRWRPPNRQADHLLLESLNLAMQNGTSNLGRLLAPLGITDIVLVERSAPLPSKGLVFEIPESIKLALSRQLDLTKSEIAPGITRYENLSALGFAAFVDSGSTIGIEFREYAAESQNILAARLISVDKFGKSYEGLLPSDSELFLAFPFSDSWRASINGEDIQPQVSLDWATGFSYNQSGLVQLNYETDSKHLLVMALQSVLWVVALFGLLRALATARRVAQ